MAPQSAQRADRLVTELTGFIEFTGFTGRAPATVVDFGCGWGELLLRVVAASPTAAGVGIDVHRPDLVRGRANASARGLGDRVAFVEGPAAEHSGSADVVLNVGVYDAFGDVGAALNALYTRVNPGGRLLFGAEFWARRPTPEQLAHLWPGSSADDCTDLAGLVDLATAAGFRPLRIETATSGEWEEYESGLAADAEEWLLTNAAHPEAGDVRARLDAQRDRWLRGHRDVLGFAYLTLGRAR